MVYQALYRKWRPQRFEDISGQEAVTKTLQNAIKQQNFSHAYLFTGPRGTGKTSAAKIMAKAVNCPHQQQGEPCNQCTLCQEITVGALGDVIEIDAASNNGVEEMRDIRDKVRYAPTQANYKVYIIDEVHMLSTGAFNALLKTLEEPPNNVVFILATTEPHKIPATIISRTQRFDFKRIGTEAIIKRIKYILEQEDIAYEEEALAVVARVASGGMRDALSLVDQIIAFGQGKVTYQEAVHVSGSLTQEMMVEYIRLLIQSKTQEALIKVQQLLDEGKEAGRFVEELIEFSRDILVAKQTGMMSYTLAGQQEFVEEVTVSFLYRCIEQLNKTQQAMRLTTKPAIYLEVFTVQMTQPSQPVETHVPIESDVVTHLQQQIQLLQQEIALLKQQSAAPRKQETKQQALNTGSYKPNIVAVYQILDQATKQDLTLLREVWQDVIMAVEDVNHKALLKSAEPVAASSTAFVLQFQYEILCQKASEDTKMQQTIQTLLQRMIQRDVTFEMIPQEQWASVRQAYILEKRKNKQEESISIASEEVAVEEKTPVEKMIDETVSVFGKEIVSIQE